MQICRSFKLQASYHNIGEKQGQETGFQDISDKFGVVLPSLDYNAVMQTLNDALSKLSSTLKERGYYLTCAESCTGGLLGHLITNTAGSSNYFIGGFLTYSNQAKEQFLGVQPETLRNHGAVSRETVLEMARGARAAFSSRFPAERILALSTSGIAGPDGGSPEKPVGTVWIGFNSETAERAEVFHFAGTREAIKMQSAVAALRMLAQELGLEEHW
jgi:nicotinamide-nucleotide amidase